LLVDAHLSNPLQHHIFDANLSPGLADILAGGKSQTGIIQPTSVDKLDLLCAGQATTSSATQSFESKVFTEMLNYWKNEYGFIIFDTPPLGEENHAVTLGKIVDGAILVVEAERVRWEVAQRAKERLTKSGTIIGGVLNKRRFYVPNWLYKTL
jgi:capsular exopolysaccharide synthesis family protein